MKWDKALTPHPSGTMYVGLPSAVGRALREQGFDRTSVEVTDEGILLRPYKSGGVKGAGAVVLPAWADE